MAFSPFRAFRKHQKAFFAGLTIVCMLTFVLAGSMSRGGDFFSWVGSLISGSRQPKVAMLYGKPVYGAELQQLRNQRQLTSQYMDLLTQQAQENFRRSMLDASSKLDDSLGASQIRQIVPKRIWPGEFRRRSELFRQRYQYLSELSRNIGNLQGLAEVLMERKQEAAAQLMEFRDQLLRDFIQIQRIKDKNELYFGGTVKLDDLIDFMIWKHEADRRGIQLTMADVRQLINRETGNKLSSGDFKTAEDYLRNQFHDRWNAETLRAGLADEFRVRIVKAAIMGEDTTGVTSSTPFTPYEFWQFYRDRRTENVIAVLPIPVRQKDFLDAVGQPKEEELKTLYNEGKETEYDPASDKPGFKIPPRIGVEWVSARADSEHYRKAAEVVLAATRATLPLAYEAALSHEYEEEKWKYRLPSWTDDFPLLLHDSSLNRPENVASLVGQLSGGSTQPQAFSGYSAYVSTATTREVHDRLCFDSTMVLSGFGPTPLGTATLACYGTPNSETRPMRELKDQLVEKLKKKMARDLLTAGLSELQNELLRLNNRKPEEVIQAESLNRPDVIASMMGALTTGSTLGQTRIAAPILFSTPVLLRDVKIRSQMGAEMFLTGTQGNAFPLAGLVYQEQNRNFEVLRKLIDGAAAKYGLQHGFSQKRRTRYDIGEDQGLKALKDSYDHFRHDHANAPQDFNALFWSTNPFLQLRAPYSPQIWPQQEIDVRDQNRIFEQFNDNLKIWSDADQPFLYWKTEDKPAYVPTFDEAKDKVLAWWKFDKARALAEKEAQQVKKEAEGQPDAERRLKDGSKHSDRWFYLTDQYGHDKVAKLVKGPQTFARPAQLEPFQFAKTQIEYPPQGLADELIAMTKPGQVIVRADQPKATYYVFALVDHAVPSTGLFYREYDISPEDLFRELEESTHYRREFEENLLVQLRREARLEIIEENRPSVDGRSRSDEE